MPRGAAAVIASVVCSAAGERDASSGRSERGSESISEWHLGQSPSPDPLLDPVTKFHDEIKVDLGDGKDEVRAITQGQDENLIKDTEEKGNDAVWYAHQFTEAVREWWPNLLAYVQMINPIRKRAKLDHEAYITQLEKGMEGTDEHAMHKFTLSPTQTNTELGKVAESLTFVEAGKLEGQAEETKALARVRAKLEVEWKDLEDVMQRHPR